MDQNLKAAAETGNVSQLYELIERDGNVLRRFDEVEFIETPLHVAAEKGCIVFAMEIMSLKPSFARKLNQRGLSPMHLAIEKGQHEMALRLLQVHKDLVRVRGKNGETSLHYLCKVENQHHLLDRFMQACPESIRDATVQNRTALHIAVENNRPDVLRVLLRLLGKNDHYQEEVNRQDEDGNTALHIAARNNQSQSDGSSKSTVGVRFGVAGETIMGRYDYLIFFIPTYCVFIVSMLVVPSSGSILYNAVHSML
ncbi:hypothetical protein V6N13_121833 [Hibiscus sabdariffa]